MKRLIPLLLSLVLLLSLAGCADTEENTHTFYYLRTRETLNHGAEDALIAPVEREISVEDPQLSYLLQLYLDGPSRENYYSPIPKGTYLLSTLWEGDTLIIVLSREFATLDNVHLTLAGACLTATCHSLTGAESIRVLSNEQTYDFALSDFTVLDDSAQAGKETQ